MKRIALGAIVLLTVTAYADKASREFFKHELTPAVKAAEAKFKSACGCALKINVANLKEEKEMRTSKYVCGSITDEAEKYCTGSQCTNEAGVTAGNDAHSAGNVATIAMAVGAVAIAGGLTLWFTAPAGNATTSVGVGPGSLQLRGAF